MERRPTAAIVPGISYLSFDQHFPDIFTKASLEKIYRKTTEKNRDKAAKQ